MYQRCRRTARPTPTTPHLPPHLLRTRHASSTRGRPRRAQPTVAGRLGRASYRCRRCGYRLTVHLSPACRGLSSNLRYCGSKVPVRYLSPACQSVLNRLLKCCHGTCPSTPSCPAAFSPRIPSLEQFWGWRRCGGPLVAPPLPRVNTLPLHLLGLAVSCHLRTPAVDGALFLARPARRRRQLLASTTESSPAAHEEVLSLFNQSEHKGV